MNSLLIYEHLLLQINLNIIFLKDRVSVCSLGWLTNCIEARTVLNLQQSSSICFYMGLLDRRQRLPQQTVKLSKLQFTGVTQTTFYLLLYFIFFKLCLTIQLYMSWNSLCRTDKFEFRGDLPGSVSQVYKLKACTAMARLKAIYFYFSCF